MMRALPALAAVLALAGAAAAQSASNAATWYGKAIEQLQRFGPADLEAIDRFREHPGREPGPEVRALLDRAGPMLRLARRGADQRFADFGLDYGRGFDLELPHLSPLRRIARVMEADVYRRLHDGDDNGASERIAALYRMAEHTGHDRVLISSLVGQAIFRTAERAMQHALDHGQVNAGQAARVLGATREFAADDPFWYVEATVMEQEVAIETLRRCVQDEDGGLQRLAGAFPEGQVLTQEISAMTPDRFEQELEQYGAAMDQVVEVFAGGAGEAGREVLGDLTGQVESGEHGLLARLFLPAMGKVYQWKLEGQEQIRQRTETLEAIAAGQLDALAEANAAVWYLRAIDAMASTEELDATTLALLRQAAGAAPGGGGGDSGADETRKTLDRGLDAASPIFELLRQASTMKRCDFSHARPDASHGPVVAPPYAGGLSNLLDLVAASARRDLERRDAEALRGRVGTAWSMLKHLEADRMFATARLAHRAFERTVELSLDGLRAGVLTPEDGAELFRLAGRLRRTDPFGYAGAVAEARDGLVRHCRRSAVSAEDFAEKRAAIEREVRELDGDQLLHVAVILDTMTRTSEEHRREAAAALAPLAGIYDLRQLEAARSDVPHVAPLLARNDIAALRALEPRGIASLAAHARQASADLRRGLRRLTPAQTPDQMPALEPIRQ